jgi:predicted aminopeptidase
VPVTHSPTQAPTHALSKVGFALLALLLLSQCRTAQFYSQAIKGQSEILSHARPITKILADPSTDPKLRSRLELIQELRLFAKQQLHLPSDGQYDRYTDLGRKHVVWVVFAAPEFSLQAHTWRYPLLGRLAYRGFFAEPPALALATQLKAQGNDVFVAGVTAYSTLGWFSDPVLNTFVHQPDRDLAELLFHELTHQQIYFRGDTDFNEALATAVGRYGAKRWLQTTGRTQELALYERESLILNDFLSELKITRNQLGQLYQQDPLPPEAKRLAKEQRLTDLRRRAQNLSHRHGSSLKLDKWFEQPVNNARLLSIATYYDLVPAFDALLQRCQGDLPSFFQALKPLRHRTKAQRLDFLRQFE